MEFKNLILLFVAVSALAFASSCNYSGNASTRGGSVKGGANPLPPLSEPEKRILDRLGGELLPDQNIKIGDITIYRRELEISFPGSVNMTDGDLEVLIAMPHGRVHESLLVSGIDPFKLQLAILLIGAENGSRYGGEKIPQGTILNIDVQPKDGRRVPVEDWLSNKKTSKGMDRFGWVFVGSSFTHDMHCLAKEEGNIVNVWSFGNAILDNPASTGDQDDFIAVNSGSVPEYATPVTVYLSFKPPGR
ncbi:MAG: YdjY domain-containing protein [Victivallales bacterium]